MYCKAPLVSASIWPNNQITPCCLWQGPAWIDIETMSKELTSRFLNDDIPDCCQGCTYRYEFDGYPNDNKLQFLDWRNDNLCNLKCRSCTPQWSSKIAQEEQVNPVRPFKLFDLDNIDWANIRSIYFCGGEPFLSEQHVEILEKISRPEQTKLHYNTNCMTLHYRNCYIPKLWSKFASITVNASIDAVGDTIECVRSGSRWNQINAVLQTLTEMHDKQQIFLNITPYMSALNIWWLEDWLQIFKSFDINQIRPIVSSCDDPQGLGIIPWTMRPSLIAILKNNKFSCQFTEAIKILEN